MENSEAQHINANLDSLVSQTVCTPSVLSGLIRRNVFSAGDVQIIESKLTDNAKSFELYRVVLTRTDAYLPLVGLLSQAGQCGAVEILNKILLVPTPHKFPVSDGDGRPAKRASEEETETTPVATHKRSNPSQELRNVVFDVLAPSNLFTGREAELRQLHQNIVGDEAGITLISEVTSVGGLGGIGKTELARRYVHLYNHLFHYVIWVLAETLESTSESLRRLSTDKLDIPTKNSNGEEKSLKSLLEDVLQVVQSSKVLFVLDNAEKEEHVKIFIQTVRCHNKKEDGDGDANKIRLLITSRNTDWGTKQAISLSEMSLTDAILFVRKGLRVAAQEDYVILSEKLVTTLQCFPLAIQQAISYIKNEDETRNYGISNYLEEFQTKTSKILNAPVSAHQHLVDYTRTTYTTWEMTLEKIATLKEKEEGQLALQILNIMAYLLPDNIPRSMFLPLQGNKEELEELVNSAVRILLKYSMIYGEAKQSKLRLHRLVQHVTRLKLSRCEEKELSVLKDAFKVTGQVEISTVGHSSSVWTHAVKYPQLVSLHPDFPVKVVQCLNNNFRFGDSHKFGLFAEESLIPVIGSQNEAVHTLNCVTIDALLRNAEYVQAINCCDEKLLTRPDGAILEQMDLKLRKGKALGFLAKYDDAIPLLKQAFEERRRILGADHKSTIKALFDFTRTSVRLGRLDDSLDISQVTTALQNFQPDDNEDWHYCFTAQCGLGVYYMSVGRYVQAKATLEKLFSTRLENSRRFEKHPQVIQGGYNLIAVLNRLGEYQQAITICEEVKRLQESVLGKAHRNVLLSRQALGICLNRLGRYSEGLEVQQGVYDELVAHPQYGRGSVWALFSKLNLGISWSGLGSHEQGLEAMEEAVSSIEKVLTESHNEVLQSKIQLAKAYARAGKVDETRKLLREVEDRIYASYGESHEDLPKIKRYLEQLPK